MSAVLVPPMRPEPERDQWGRYLLRDRETGRSRGWTRVSTLAKCMADETLLTLWKRRMVAVGVAEHGRMLLDDGYELAEAVAAANLALTEATDRDELRAAKDRLNELCDLAHNLAGGDRGSDLGTALHALTEWSDAGRLGELDEPPPALELDRLAYVQAMADEEIERPVEWIERVVVNETLGVAGTFDRILVMPFDCPRCGCHRRIGDLKTQKSIDFGWLDIAIQLAAYANADYMIDLRTGEPEPMPTVCRCVAIVMWLPVGKAKCTLHEIDIKRGWEFALLGRDVRAARAAGKSLGRPYERPSGVSRPRDRSQLTYLIEHAGSPEALVGLWRDAAARGEWTDAHTAAAKLRRAELERALAEVAS